MYCFLLQSLQHFYNNPLGPNSYLLKFLLEINNAKIYRGIYVYAPVIISNSRIKQFVLPYFNQVTKEII